MQKFSIRKVSCIFLIFLTLLISGCSNFYKIQYEDISEKYESCRTNYEDLRVENAGLRASIENGMSNAEEKKALDEFSENLSKQSERIDSAQDQLFQETGELRDKFFECGENSGVAKQSEQQISSLNSQISDLRNQLEAERFWKNLFLFLLFTGLVIIVTVMALSLLFIEPLASYLLRFIKRITGKEYLDANLENVTSPEAEALFKEQQERKAISSSDSQA